MDLMKPGMDGAISYLLKDISHTELADAIRAAAHGEEIIHPKVATRLLNILQK
jgi:two-component system, NarL family, response regulator LiaR